MNPLNAVTTGKGKMILRYPLDVLSGGGGGVMTLALNDAACNEIVG